MGILAMITVNQVYHNLQVVLAQANGDDYANGSMWYREAHEYCTALSTESAYSLATVVGIVAALSPQVTWPENKEVAARLLLGNDVGVTLVYPANLKKAQRILHGENPLDVLGGRKVLAFYHNILYWQSSRSITIDTHAARAAFNRKELSKRHLYFTFHPYSNGNNIIRQGYSRLAKEMDLLPSTLQAIVWHVSKRIYGREITWIEKR